MYPRAVMERQIKSSNKTCVGHKRALDTLGHPDKPAVSLERVSHIATELHLVGNEIYSKAKIIDTPDGKIAENLLNDGVSLGVTWRWFDREGWPGERL